jgi:hypothetical protein
MALLERLTEVAKKNLVRDGHIAAAFILTKGEEFVFPPSPMSVLERICAKQGMGNLNLEETKTRDTLLVGGLARAYGADRVILIWDAAFKMAVPGTKYDDTQAPLTYPKSMRTECILINEVLLPSGQNKTILIPYKGGEGEPVEFIPTEDKMAKAMSEGKFQSRFTELILEGYNKAEAIL